MRGKIWLPLLSLGMLCLAIYHTVSAGQEGELPTPLIEPAQSPYIKTLAGSGIVEPMSENIAIGSALPGVVEEVFVKVGDQVKGPSWFDAGTPLFRLDDRQLQAEYRVRQALLVAAEANLSKLEAMPRPEEVPPLEARLRESKAQLEDQRDQLQRSQKLFSDRAVGEEEFWRRKQAYQSALALTERNQAELTLLKKGAWEADKIVSRSQVEQARATLAQTQIELNRLIVRAPIDGEVLQRNVRPGEFVGAPPGQALMILGDVSTLHIRADFDENDIPLFNEKLTGFATVRGAPLLRRGLRFVRVEPYVVPKKTLTGSATERVDTRVLQVIFALEPGEGRWYVGQQVDLFLERE